MRRYLVIISLLLLPLSANGAPRDALVSVASNFRSTMYALVEQYQLESGFQLKIASASTGKLYAQILAGAPYDLFFSADSRRPELLQQADKVHSNFRKDYALGRLVLWYPKANTAPGKSWLSERWKYLAMANPKTAPYGLASQQTLAALGLWLSLKDKLVQGENIAQSHQFVASGNAPLGFTAAALLNNTDPNQRWLVPTSLHQPIRQQAVLLTHAEDNPAAIGFWEFISQAAAQTIIRNAGYDLPALDLLTTE